MYFPYVNLLSISMHYYYLFKFTKTVILFLTVVYFAFSVRLNEYISSGLFYSTINHPQW
jgi:hypothetical protein